MGRYTDATFEQQGHSTETHDRDYDRLEDHSANMKMHSQLRFEHASLSWQNLVFPGGERLEKRIDDRLQPTGELESVRLEVEKTGRGQTPMLQTAKVETPKLPSSVPISALNSLRTLLGQPTATFRSEEQALATAAMLEQGKSHSNRIVDDLLVILPTGTGKTLTWMVAQHLESRDSLTIVIVPLKALLMDLSARLKFHGQPVHVCSGETAGLGLEGRSGFVLTSVERAVEADAIREIHAMEHRIVGIK